MVSHYVERKSTGREREGLISSQKALYYILLLIKSYATPILIMSRARMARCCPGPLHMLYLISATEKTSLGLHHILNVSIICFCHYSS